MNGEGIPLISPLIGLGANVAVQVLAFRFCVTGSLLKSIMGGFGIGLLAVITQDFIFFFSYTSGVENIIGISLANLLTYMALGYCYFHFINLGETARRVRILREIHDSGSGLSQKEILSRYNGKTILEYRMRRLLSNGQVIFKGGKYFIGNSTMLFITKIILALKRMVIGKKSEFD